MNIREKYTLKRMALGMTQKEFAAIAKVDEGIVSLFERGEYIDPPTCSAYTWNVESYIHALDRVNYLKTRIIEETLLLSHEPEEDHLHTLSHLQIHVAKLNMMYVK